MDLKLWGTVLDTKEFQIILAQNKGSCISIYLFILVIVLDCLFVVYWF